MAFDEGTLVTNVESGQPVLRRLELRVQAGPDQGLTHELGVGTLLCGTHRDVDVRLADPRVSRRHCELSVVADGLRVRDLGSKNGVWIGEARIDETVVGSGAMITVGDTVLRVTAVEAPLDLGEGLSSFGNLVTRSPAMRRVLGLLDRVSSSDATVLLEGETGVGKDVIARALHSAGPRGDGPFLVFDCAAVSPHLIAGELFGHKKGAFTGAERDRAGVFEAARGGTVFLDEIGELALDLQPSLLRVLESRQVKRVGENITRPIDVRVIAATNRDLRDEVKARRFREDLFFRLAIVRVKIPPLRERSEDIDLLARRFIVEFGRVADELDGPRMKQLKAHPWPGNVRELRNVIEQSVALSTREFKIGLQSNVEPQTRERPVSWATLPAESALDSPAVAHSGSSSSGGTTKREFGKPGGASAPNNDVTDLLNQPFKDARVAAIEQFERAYLGNLLGREGGNVSAAARTAGIDRNYLYRLMKRYGMDGEEFR